MGVVIVVSPPVIGTSPMCGGDQAWAQVVPDTLPPG